MAFEQNQETAMKALEEMFEAFFRMAKEDGVDTAITEINLMIVAAMEAIVKLEEMKTQIQGTPQ